MRRITIAVQEADRDAFHLLFLEEGCRGAYRVDVQGGDDPPLGVDALRDVQSMAARHQRLRLFPRQVEHVRRTTPSDLEHIAEARSGQTAGAGARLLREDRERAREGKRGSG